jgi:hypothetical protein
LNQLNVSRQTLMLHDLVEGSSLRAVERKHQHSFNTVMRLFENAGDMAIAYFEELKDLQCRWIQADEFHTFVGTRRRVDPITGQPTSGLGTVWVYLAVDADTKMVVDFLPATREVYDATAFFKSIAGKLRRAPEGGFAVRPTIITDGLPAYKEAAAIAFGTDADVGMLIKKYEKFSKNGKKLGRERYIGADRVPIIGSPNFEDIHTSFIERTNLNVRMDIKRFTRKTNAFSKKLLNAKRHLALWAMYFNFCRVHSKLRMPPAMAAGLTDHIWGVSEIVDRTNVFVKERLRRQAANDAEVCEAPAHENAPSHWVYHRKTQYRANIHTAGCHHSKRRDEVDRNSGKHGSWTGYWSFDDALAAAALLEPDRHDICKMCLGSYRNQGGYRGPR